MTNIGPVQQLTHGDMPIILGYDAQRHNTHHLAMLVHALLGSHNANTERPQLENFVCFVDISNAPTHQVNSLAEGCVLPDEDYREVPQNIVPRATRVRMNPETAGTQKYYSSGRTLHM